VGAISAVIAGVWEGTVVAAGQGPWQKRDWGLRDVLGIRGRGKGRGLKS